MLRKGTLLFASLLCLSSSAFADEPQTPDESAQTKASQVQTQEDTSPVQVIQGREITPDDYPLILDKDGVLLESLDAPPPLRIVHDDTETPVAQDDAGPQK